MHGCREQGERHLAHCQRQEEGRQSCEPLGHHKMGRVRTTETQKLLGTGSYKMGLLAESALGLAVRSGKRAGTKGQAAQGALTPNTGGAAGVCTLWGEGASTPAGQPALTPPPFILFLNTFSQPQRHPSMASKPSKDPYNLAFAEGSCHFQSGPRTGGSKPLCGSEPQTPRSPDSVMPPMSPLNTNGQDPEPDVLEYGQPKSC